MTDTERTRAARARLAAAQRDFAHREQMHDADLVANRFRTYRDELRSRASLNRVSRDVYTAKIMLGYALAEQTGIPFVEAGGDGI